MFRLCLQGLSAGSIALVCFGCSGQSIEGTWIGPLPVEDSNACHIKIYSDHRFDVSCGHLDSVGNGNIEREGNIFTLKFQNWVRRGKVQSEKPNLKMIFDGQGNMMRLHEPQNEGKVYIWERSRV